MMQAKIKKAWLDALRSGNYQQMSEVLRARDEWGGYCCLGVLLDVAINEGFLPKLALEWTEDDQVAYDWPSDREASLEDGHVYEGSTTDGQLGLELDAAFGIDPSIESDLVNMNDSGEDFFVIADYIEEVL